MKQGSWTVLFMWSLMISPPCSESELRYALVGGIKVNRHLPLPLGMGMVW